MTYTEAIEQLCAMCEAACAEYEFDIIAEAADGGEISTEVKTGHANKIIIMIKKAAEFLKSLIRKIIDFVRKKFNTHSVYTVSNDCELANVLVKPNNAYPVILGARNSLRTRRGLNSSKGDEELISKLGELSAKTMVKAGNFTIKDDVIVKIIKVLEDAAKGSEGIEKLNMDTPIEELRFKNDLLRAINTLVSAFNAGIKCLVLVDKEGNKPNENVREIQSESVDILQFKSEADRTKYIDLILEAAAALKNGKVLSEDANSTIDPAKQKEIENIPEEKPVDTKEYPEDTSGGEGKQEDHLEAIKDLIDGDSKAMDLLTKDDRSTTISESIDLVFDL